MYSTVASSKTSQYLHKTVYQQNYVVFHNHPHVSIQKYNLPYIQLRSYHAPKVLQHHSIYNYSTYRFLLELLIFYILPNDIMILYTVFDIPSSIISSATFYFTLQSVSYQCQNFKTVTENQTLGQHLVTINNFQYVTHTISKLLLVTYGKACFPKSQCTKLTHAVMVTYVKQYHVHRPIFEESRWATVVQYITGSLISFNSAVSKIKMYFVGRKYCTAILYLTLSDQILKQYKLIQPRG